MYTARRNGSLALATEENDSVSKYSNLVDFEEKFRNPADESSFNIKQKFQTAIRKKMSKCNARKTVQTYFPIIKTITTYNVKEYLPNDLIAGLTAGVMMIPQGMAFAALSTLPPIVGLYISFFASITYVIFGTGRQLSWGCKSIISLMLVSIFEKYESKFASDSSLVCVNNNLPNNVLTTAPPLDALSATKNNESSSDIHDITRRRMEVASAMSVIVGLVLILASRIGLSRVTALMSDSLITGFTVGISFHVITNQIKYIIGISVTSYKGPLQLIRTWITIIEHIGDTNVATLITSVICMLIIYLVKRHINERFKEKMRIPIPIEIFVVIAATFASQYGYFHQNYGMKIVEDVPIGVPAPKLPNVTLVTDYIGDALVIIIVSYAQSLAMAKTMGLKHNYHINVPQEMLACGMCSVICGLFSGYIPGASITASVVQDGLGGKTQVASLFAAGLVLLVIMVIGPYFYYLPECVLSAIIVVNLKSWFLKLFDIPQEWRKSKYDCSIWVFTCVATIVLNPDLGLLAGVIFSIFPFLFKSMAAPIEETGQIQTSSVTVHLRSLENYPSVQKLHNVKILRVKTPLYFINSDIFLSIVLKSMNFYRMIKKKENKNLSNEGVSKERKSTSSGNLMNQAHSSKGNPCIEKGESTELFELKVVLLDMAEVTFIDAMGVKALELLIRQSSKVDVAMLFTNIPESIFPMLQSTGFWKKHGDCLFLTVETALHSLAEALVIKEKDS